MPAKRGLLAVVDACLGIARVARAAAPLALGLSLFGSISAPGGAVAQDPDRARRQSIAFELFFPEDRDNRDIRVATLMHEFERHLIAGFRSRVGVGAIFTEGVYVRDEGPRGVELEADGLGLHVLAFLGWRPVRVGPIAPFVEGAFGAVFTTEDFPPDGKKWNYQQRYGLGLDLRLSARIHLAVAYRHMHLSNGTGLGPQNPSYDGDGLVLAVAW